MRVKLRSAQARQPTLSQHTDNWPATPSPHPIMLSACQGSYCRTNVEVTGMTRPGKEGCVSAVLEVDVLPLGHQDSQCCVATRGVRASTSALLACHQW